MHTTVPGRGSKSTRYVKLPPGRAEVPLILAQPDDNIMIAAMKTVGTDIPGFGLRMVLYWGLVKIKQRAAAPAAWKPAGCAVWRIVVGRRIPLDKFMRYVLQFAATDAWRVARGAWRVARG